jgi:hypothetical protein
MPPRERARSTRELLEQEEQQALAALRDSLTAAGEDLCALSEVRELARRHPELAVAASAAVGAALAPFLVRIAGAALPALLTQLSRPRGSLSLTALLPRTRP